VLGKVKAEQGETAALRLARHAALLMALVLTLVCVVAIIGAPVLVWLMTGGFGGQPQTFDLAVMLTRWMFPYILMISLVALASGVLNTWSSFKAPAFAPVLLNLSFIGCAVLLSPLLDEPIWALAIAVILGGLAQLGLMAWAITQTVGKSARSDDKNNINVSKTKVDSRSQKLNEFNNQAEEKESLMNGLLAAWKDPHVKRVLTLMLPATLAVSVAQVSLVINTHIAARLQAGSVSWLSYADRLMEFPTALLGVALGTVLLPSLTRANSTKNMAQVNALIDWGLRLVAVLAIPSAVGLAVLAVPLAAALFHYGRFDHQALVMTAQAMTGYSLGLVGLIAIKVLAPGFYAQQNIKTPVKIALFTLVLTQALNLVFVPLFNHAGLAVATSLAACANAFLLYRGLRRRGVYAPSAGWGLFLGKVGLSALIMGAAIGVVAAEFEWASLAATPVIRLVWLGIIFLIAAVVYFGCLRLMGLQWQQFLKKEVT
jgi:putative peptidoglycan lipid II flippase